MLETRCLKNLHKSFDTLFDCVDKIQDFENNQGYYLDSSIENAWSELMTFFGSHNFFITMSNQKCVRIML